MPNPLAIGVTLGGLLLDVDRATAQASGWTVRRADSPLGALLEDTVVRTTREEHDVRRSRAGSVTPMRAGGGTVQAVSSFAVKFLGCKVSQADAMLARSALLAAGHARGARGRGRPARHQHVLHHQRGRGEVAPVGPPLAEDARARSTSSGCAVNLNAAAVRGDRPERVTPFVGTADDVAAEIAGDRACADLEHDVLARQPAEQAARTRGFVKVQDGCDCHCAYCIIPTVRGSARSRPAGAVLDEVRRRVAQRPARDRDDRHQRRRLPRSRAGTRARRADGRGRRDRRGAARAAVERRGDPRQGFAHRRAAPPSRRCARTSTSRCSPATTRCCATWAATTRAPSTSSTSRRCAQAVPEVNVTTDVIVGFPTEDEAAFERTLEAIDAAGDHPRPRVLLLAAARHRRRGARRPRHPAGEEAPLAGAARPLGGPLAPAPRRQARQPRAVLSTRSPTRSARATPPTTRAATCRRVRRRAASSSTPSCEELHADGIACRGSGGRQGYPEGRDCHRAGSRPT